MTKHREDQYEFPCAVIRGNERTLLSKSDMLKVIESKQFQAAMNVLGEFGYGDGKELESPRDFEKVLRAEQVRVSQLVFSILPEKEELEFLLYPNDYHNVKVTLKSEALGVPPKGYLVSGGTVEAETMAQMVKERNFIFFSLTMKQGIWEALDLFAKGRDPQEIDIILDKACYKDMLEKAEATEDEFLIGYVKVKESGKYTVLEKLCDDLRMKYIKDAKYVTAGIAPIAAFFIAKESEIKNLRMILTGKLSSASEEIMKERLRETYV